METTTVLIAATIVSAICSAIMTKPDRYSWDEPLAECLPFGLIALWLMLSSAFSGFIVFSENWKLGLICAVDYIGVWMLVRYLVKLPGKRERKRAAERERKEAERKEKQRNCRHNNWQPYGSPRYDMAYGQDQDFICPDCGTIITRWPEWRGDNN